jgi:hypothetical protein
LARFEREVTGERVRDKIAASKCKGMWMGGLVPLGYEVRERQLAVVESEAATVRLIFQRCCDLGGVRLLKQELDRDGFCSKLRIASNGSGTGEKSFSRGAPYTLLRNPTTWARCDTRAHAIQPSISRSSNVRCGTRPRNFSAPIRLGPREAQRIDAQSAHRQTLKCFSAPAKSPRQKCVNCLQRFNSEPGDALKLSHPRLG